MSELFQITHNIFITLSDMVQGVKLTCLSTHSLHCVSYLICIIYMHIPSFTLLNSQFQTKK